MRRILSLLMALVLAIGVCVFFSSCEAEKGLVQSSEIGESWNDFMYGGKIDEIRVYYGSLASLLASSSTIDPYRTFRDHLDEMLVHIRELESHVTEKLDSGHEYSETLQTGICIFNLGSKDQKGRLEIVLTDDNTVCITYFESSKRIREFFKLDISSEEFVDKTKAVFKSELP